jgi:Pyruvate/2-oxoacid:ferredoxin oxidoreductase delta subunit
MATKKVAKIKEEDKVYEELRQLYQARRTPATMKLFKFLFPNPEEAEICKHLASGGKLKTAAEVAKLSGKDLKKVQEILDNKTKLGIFRSRERKGTPGVMEYSNGSFGSLRHTWGHVAKDDAEGLVYREIAYKLRDEEAIPENYKPRPLLIDKVITPETKILPYESASEVIKAVAKSGKHIAITYCNCRETRRKCDRRKPNCINFGPGADYWVQYSRTIPGAHPVDYATEEEALKCLDECFKDGLVANIKAHGSEVRGEKPKFEEIAAVCNCCTCCCRELSRYVEFGARTQPDFLPEINQEECTLCEACVKICPVNARWHHWPDKPDLSDDFIALDEKKCIGCGLCAYHCPRKALTMVRERFNSIGIGNYNGPGSPA